jgi:hypothetical protein
MHFCKFNSKNINKKHPLFCKTFAILDFAISKQMNNFAP